MWFYSRVVTYGGLFLIFRASRIEFRYYIYSQRSEGQIWQIRAFIGQKFKKEIPVFQMIFHSIRLARLSLAK